MKLYNMIKYYTEYGEKSIVLEMMSLEAATGFKNDHQGIQLELFENDKLPVQICERRSVEFIYLIEEMK